MGAVLVAELQPTELVVSDDALRSCGDGLVEAEELEDLDALRGGIASARLAPDAVKMK